MAQLAEVDILPCVAYSNTILKFYCCSQYNNIIVKFMSTNKMRHKITRVWVPFHHNDFLTRKAQTKTDNKLSPQAKKKCIKQKNILIMALPHKLI